MSSTVAPPETSAMSGPGKSLWIAVVCGAAPLAIGTGIFLTWLATRWDRLMLAGLWTIPLGCIAFFIGCAALAIYHATGPTHHRSRNTLLAGLLLVANFPAAGAITVAAMIVESCYSIKVLNASPETLTEVTVSGGGERAELGTLAPGESASARFWIRHDDELTFSARSDGRQLQATVDGYVTNGMGGNTQITVTGPRIISRTSRNESLITERTP